MLGNVESTRIHYTQEFCLNRVKLGTCLTLWPGLRRCFPLVVRLLRHGDSEIVRQGVRSQQVYGLGDLVKLQKTLRRVQLAQEPAHTKDMKQGASN